MPTDGRPGRTVSTRIICARNGSAYSRVDELATEEPLEVRVAYFQGGVEVSRGIAVTMRTPGNDFELAAGFLYSEGVITGPESIDHIAYCTDLEGPQMYNVVTVHLRPGVPFDPERFSRNVYTTSSCGVCGKASLELVRTVCPGRPVGNLKLRPELILSLPKALARAQLVFARTGGLHASALFDAAGNLLLIREDVGRHNAMDKLIGALLLAGKLPASNTIVLVSGRASFELVQKAVMGGIPVLAAVGAPSSLAVELAREFGLTLLGFLRGDQFNVYAGAERVEGLGAVAGTR